MKIKIFFIICAISLTATSGFAGENEGAGKKAKPSEAEIQARMTARIDKIEARLEKAGDRISAKLTGEKLAAFEAKRAELKAKVQELKGKAATMDRAALKTELKELRAQIKEIRKTYGSPGENGPGNKNRSSQSGVGAAAAN